MPQVIPFIVKVLATKIIAGITIKAIVIAVIKVAVAYAISRAMSKGARSKAAGLGSATGSEMTLSREPAPARRVVYGRTRVSGPMAFAHISGIDNSDMHIIVLLACHECDGVSAYYIDDEAVSMDVDGNAIEPQKYKNILGIKPYLGTQTTSIASLATATGGAWWGSDVIKGTTYIYAKLVFDAGTYSGGLPNISVVLRGKKLLDPRTSTIAFSRNPALILRDYLSNSDYGMGAVDGEIDDDSFIAAANICDETVNTIESNEPRYRCDGVFATDAEPATVIEQILATMGGSMIYSGGKFKVQAGAYYAPTVTLDEGDLRGPIQYQTASGIRESCNIVKGVYTSPVDMYQPRDFPQYRDAEHVSDDGEEITTDLDLAWVSSPSQAQRIAKVYEKSSRLGGTITLQCNLAAMRVQAGDTVAINNTRFGWSPKVFTVQEFRFSIGQDGAPGVDLVCRETSPDVYGWVAGTDEQTVLPGLTISNPDHNTGLVIIATLDNDSATVPAAHDGSSPALGMAATTITVWAGGSDDSTNWTYAATPSTGVSGSLVDRTWTTTGFTSDSGCVDITASRTNYSSITVRFSLGKAKAGADGANGINGTNGIAGTNGQTTYFHVAYANSADGSVGFNQASGTYIGTYVDFTPADSGSYAAYQWVLLKGADGASGTNGIAGVNGSNGQTSYLHIKYSDDNGATFTASSGEAVGKYIGTYTDFTLADSMSVGSYTWALIKGADSTAYWLVSSAAAIQKTTAGAYTPSIITASAKYQAGEGSPGAYSGRFIIAESNDGSNFSDVYTSGGDESSASRTPAAGIKVLRIRLYKAGGTSLLLDEEALPVVSDGTNGVDGINGGTVLGTIGGAATVDSGAGWRAIGATYMSGTVPSGTRLVTATGELTNIGGVSNNISAGLYSNGSLVEAYGPYSVPNGQTIPFTIIYTHTRTAGTQTYQLYAEGSVNAASSIVLGGSITSL